MDIETIRRCCRNAKLSEERRVKIGEYDCFIADGWSGEPGFTFQRFGVTDTDFPNGCFAAFWWIAEGEERVLVGKAQFFHPDHDMSLGSNEARKCARLNSAQKEAEEFVAKRKRVQLNG